MITIILLILLFWLLYPVFSRFFGPMVKRWLMRKAVNQFARRAGFDPEAFTANKKTKSKSTRKQKGAGTNNRKTKPGRRSPIIPEGYAEDVEFTEIHSYSEETRIGDGKIHTVTEEQVTDAEIIEIRKSKAS